MSMVLNGNDGPRILAESEDVDHTAWGRELNGVGGNIIEHLPYAQGIKGQQQLFHLSAAKGQALTARLYLDGRNHRYDNVFYVYRLPAKFKFAPLNAVQVEQIVYEFQ
jgi:uncharacterized protein YqiB (DUF1249 family)